MGIHCLLTNYRVHKIVIVFLNVYWNRNFKDYNSVKLAICSNLDGSREYRTKRGKTTKDKYYDNMQPKKGLK